MKKGASADGPTLGGDREGPSRGGRHAPSFLIFTDLDGTLLDHDSYRWDEAGPALRLCKEQRVPVVLVSSKTRAEMDHLRRELELSLPFVSENGGGIFFPKEAVSGPPEGTLPKGNLWAWSLGPSYEVLVQALRDIQEELGWTLRGFSDMTLEEIAQLTGLDSEACRLAAQREYDEPFVITGQDDFDLTRLYDAAGRRGLQVTTGGRFHHLQGRIDKGEAVGKLTAWYRRDLPRVITVALGDSPNDFTMLKRVDRPVLIRSFHDFPGLEKEIPGVSITRETGPRGWNQAVLELLAGS